MKKLLAFLLAATLLLTAVSALGEGEKAAAPKYVFMFIGDGMGAPQVNATEYYLGTIANPDAEMPVLAPLSFTDFANVGLMTTYDATSFCPDSASTATSMASGNKTLSGVVNYSIDGTTPFKLITEYAKEAGMKVGVVTSVSLDHATPAAYYSKAQSRHEYYNIATQGVTGSTLDFLGGGNYLAPDGEDSTSENIIQLATENGWNVLSDDAAIEAVTADSGKTLALTPDLGGSSAMLYEIDRADDQLSLASMTQAAVNDLTGDDGFFLMVEGGKIDWSCHANDAATSIHETIAFSDAVQVAIDFYNAHPDETLIIVTGDHETGGLTIGFATTGYSTHFQYLANQTMSFEAFTGKVSEMRDAGTDFDGALAAIKDAFGLTTEADQDLTLNEDELSKLKAAYELSMLPSEERVLGDAEKLLYGGYDPLTMACSHILNNKAGVDFTSYSHTGLQIPVYAEGVGAEIFSGAYDNTDIFTKTMSAMGLSAN